MPAPGASRCTHSAPHAPGGRCTSPTCSAEAHTGRDGVPLVRPWRCWSAHGRTSIPAALCRSHGHAGVPVGGVAQELPLVASPLCSRCWRLSAWWCASRRRPETRTWMPPSGRGSAHLAARRRGCVGPARATAGAAPGGRCCRRPARLGRAAGGRAAGSRRSGPASGWGRPSSGGRLRLSGSRVCSRGPARRRPRKTPQWRRSCGGVGRVSVWPNAGAGER